MASIMGSSRNDTLVGTTWSDLFNGFEGSDTFVIGLNGGFDAFHDTGTVGTDRIVAQEADVAIGLQSGFGPASGIEEITADGMANVWVQGDVTDDVLDLSATRLTGIVKIAGGNGSDTITGSAAGDDIRGNNDADSLWGGEGNDRLFGGDSNDLDPIHNLLHGLDGRDSLDGGLGDDVLAGGAGADTLLGGEGADVLQGGSGADVLTGGEGADVFRWAATWEGGDLVLDFGQGVDVIDLSRLDARSATRPQNDAFAWGGEAPGASAHAATYHVEDGNTVLLADVNGDRVADLTLTLTGVYALTAADVLL